METPQKMSEPDAKQVEAIEEKLKNAVKRLREIAPLVGVAHTVIEYDSERRKNALAIEQVAFIKRGESVAGSEACARASPTYQEKIKELETQFTEAQRQILEWKATMCSWETGRSLLAQQRESMRTLQG